MRKRDRSDLGRREFLVKVDAADYDYDLSDLIRVKLVFERERAKGRIMKGAEQIRCLMTRDRALLTTEVLYAAKIEDLL